MKILLVDDSLANRRAGKRQLEADGHEVVTTCEYVEALRLVKTETFDVALLDLLMPAESLMLGPDARAEHVGRETAIGFPLVLTMAMNVKFIAVATATNHHNHPMSAAVDWFYGRTVIVDGARVRIMHSPMVEGAKDWAEVLQRLLAD